MKSFSQSPVTGTATRAAAPVKSLHLSFNSCSSESGVTTTTKATQAPHRRALILLLALLCLSLWSRPAEASDSDTAAVQMEGIVVVANSESTPVREIGSSVTIITAQEIKQSQKQSVTEVLRDVPGLDVVQTGARGGQTSVFMRGANSGHTLVLIDGVEMNDPSSPNGAFDFADLSVENIERIEVLRGSQSILYGSDAIGGVIDIITRDGSGPPKTTLSANYGAYTTSKLSATTSGAKPHVSYSVGVSRTDTKGFSATDSRPNNERDGFGLTSLSGKLVLRPDEFTQLRFMARSSQSATDLDKGFGSSVDSVIFDDLNNRQTAHKSFLKAEAETTSRNNIWRAKISAALANTTRTSNDAPDAVYGPGFSAANYDAETSHFAFKGVVTPFAKQRLIVGVETERELMSSTTDFGFGANTLNGLHARTTGVYGLAQVSALDKVFVTVGVRNDNHERFGNHTSFRATSAFAIPRTKTRLKASYGDGFNAPSLFELFDPTYGDTTLQPEESESWDIGFEQRVLAERIAFGVTWFHQSITNIFGSDASFRTINIASARSEGAEVFVSVRSKSLAARVDYTYTDAIDRADGSALVRRAKNKVAGRVTYTLDEQTSAGLQVLHVGPRPGVAPTSYTVVGMTAQRGVFENVTVTGRIDNLFNERYQEVLHYSTSGRAAYFGVRYTL